MDGSSDSDRMHRGLACDDGIVGGSRATERLRRDIVRLAPLPAPVLVTGESGTGKELVARALHAHSPRRDRPFVAVNTAAVPGSLIASELFGHVRGAFTGAHAAHPGLFEQADGGTLFLDEIGSVPLDLQAWLLRVLEDGEVRPLGATRSRRVDVRVIAATHVDLANACTCGWFRPDLYWRLAVLTVHIRPLRERREDILAIAEHLLGQLALPGSPRLTSQSLQALLAHDWPGNVRELRSVLLRAAASAACPELSASEVVRAIGRRFGPVSDAESIEDAMAQTGGNVAAAARLLGIARSTLRDRLRERVPELLN